MKKSYSLRVFFTALFIVLIAGCNKTKIDEEYPDQASKKSKDEPVTFSHPVYFIGHKGAGSNNYNDVNMEHSIASIKEALKVLEGVEVDLQMSLDGTIWMFHDIDINYSLCSPGAPRSIVTMHDNEISQLKLCSRTKKDRVYKLSELVSLWNADPKGFYLSLEIKEDFEAATYNAVGGRTTYLKKLAKQLANEFRVINHPAEQLLVEEDDRIFPDEFSKYPIGKQVKYYIFEYKSFTTMVNDAIAMNFDGVSCNFTDKTITAASVKAAQDKGLKVQLWTPYYDSEVLKVYKMGPDFIQTDHTNVKANLGIH